MDRDQPNRIGSTSLDLYHDLPAELLHPLALHLLPDLFEVRLGVQIGGYAEYGSDRPMVT
jgi:hypothetical protein